MGSLQGQMRLQPQAPRGELGQGRPVFTWWKVDFNDSSEMTHQLFPCEWMTRQGLVVGPFREQPRPATSPLADCRTKMDDLPVRGARAGPATAR